MSCSGCSGAVTRVLSKAQGKLLFLSPSERYAHLRISLQHRNGTNNTFTIGVSSFDVNLTTQEVVVKGTIPYDDVLAKIKKTGKEVRLPSSLSIPLTLLIYHPTPASHLPHPVCHSDRASPYLVITPYPALLICRTYMY